MRKIYTVLLAAGLILAPYSIKARTHPDEKTFTEDRIDCYNKELDMRQVYAHRNTSSIPEGINVFERPSLKIQLIWHIFGPDRIYNPTMDKHFIVKDGAAQTATKKEFEAEFHKYWNRPQSTAFIMAWRNCIKQQSKN